MSSMTHKDKKRKAGQLVIRIFLLTTFVPIDLPTLTTMFYTILVHYFSLGLYFTIYLYAIQPVSYTFQCRLCPVLLCYCTSSFSNVFSFYTFTFFLWHAATILITSWWPIDDVRVMLDLALVRWVLAAVRWAFLSSFSLLFVASFLLLFPRDASYPS